MEFHTGDQPEEGRYRCKNCGYIVRITSDTEKLPACPNCGHHEFEKLEEGYRTECVSAIICFPQVETYKSRR